MCSPGLRDGFHAQRVQGDLLGAGDAVGQVVFQIHVHQEAHRAPVHAIDGLVHVDEAVKRFQHEPVPAERDDDVGVLGRRMSIAVAQAHQGFLSQIRLGGDEGDCGMVGVDHDWPFDAGARSIAGLTPQAKVPLHGSRRRIGQIRWMAGFPQRLCPASVTDD